MAAGSTELTPEQQQWYLDRYGVRMTHVQEQPLRQARRVRRAKVKNGVRNVHPADADVANAQHDIRVRLARFPLQSEVP